jgi:hypothetical protein
MKQNIFPILGILFCASAEAQVNFAASNIPSQVGQYSRAYYSTNVNVASLLALTNGPQRWDFSQPKQLNETILRTDIIATGNGYDGGSFPAASYSEQDTMEPNSQIAWRYYSVTNQGRLYYGFYNPVDQNATYLVVFNQPTVDVPASVQYGQTWNRTVTWNGLVLGFFPINYQFTCNAAVDAYGTLTLPTIGAVSALRVHETHGYQSSEPNGDGTSTVVDLHTNQYYYWLVPGLGVAAQVLQLGDNVLFPLGLPNTNTVLRVFQANYFTNQTVLGGVNGLHIRLQAGLAIVNWLPFTNASGYRIEAAGLLANTNTNWQLLGLPMSNSWSDTLTTTQRFYRVFAKP